MRLSVIVPVYNAERFLTECIESILSQPINDMEIICVNDGSKDGSMDIMRDLAGRDSRIRIIDKVNTGYGDSMNTGIADATGEYIALLESDDMLVPEALSLLLEKAESSHADVVKGNYYIWYSEEGREELYDNLKAYRDNEVVKNKEALFFTAPSLWSAVYRKDFIQKKKLRFLPTPGAAYQDTSFAFKVWACAEKIITMKMPVVYYRQDNEQSSSNENGKVFNICDEFREIERFILENNLQEIGPIYAKVKYISYFWNVNRLTTSKKIEFLNGIYEELVLLKEQNWLEKRLWNDIEWNLIQACICHFTAFKQMLLDGKTIWEASETLKQEGKEENKNENN